MYSTDGTLLHEDVYDEGDDAARDIAIDASGNVYVTGTSCGYFPDNPDVHQCYALTIKYDSILHLNGQRVR
jgi:hypothetical protein